LLPALAVIAPFAAVTEPLLSDNPLLLLPVSVKVAALAFILPPIVVLLPEPVTDRRKLPFVAV